MTEKNEEVLEENKDTDVIEHNTEPNASGNKKKKTTIIVSAIILILVSVLFYLNMTKNNEVDYTKKEFEVMDNRDYESLLQNIRANNDEVMFEKGEGDVLFNYLTKDDEVAKLVVTKKEDNKAEGSKQRKSFEYTVISSDEDYPEEIKKIEFSKSGEFSSTHYTLKFLNGGDKRVEEYLIPFDKNHELSSEYIQAVTLPFEFGNEQNLSLELRLHKNSNDKIHFETQERFTYFDKMTDEDYDNAISYAKAYNVVKPELAKNFQGEFDANSGKMNLTDIDSDNKYEHNYKHEYEDKFDRLDMLILMSILSLEYDSIVDFDDEVASNESTVESTEVATKESTEEKKEDTKSTLNNSLNIDLDNVKFNSEYNVATENGKTNLRGTELGYYQHLIFKEDNDNFLYSLKSPTQRNRAEHYQASTEEYINVFNHDNSHTTKVYREYRDKYTEDILKNEGYDSYAEFLISNSNTLSHSIIIITEKDGEIIATINPHNGTTLANRLDTAMLKISTVGYKDAIENKDLSLAYNSTESTDKPFMLIESDAKNTENTSYIIANEDILGSGTFAINNTDYAEDYQIATMAMVIAIDSLFFS